MKISSILSVIIGFLLVACGPDDDQLEQAFDAGWNMAYKERCRGIEPPLMMPKKYDDSQKNGELVRHYRHGIAEAKSDRDLCE